MRFLILFEDSVLTVVVQLACLNLCVNFLPSIVLHVIEKFHAKLNLLHLSLWLEFQDVLLLSNFSFQCRYYLRVIIFHFSE